jgi:3-deoxy-D-manno-octulosonic-acid transferase
VSAAERAYAALVPLLRGGARLAAWRRPKVRAGLAGRRGLQARLAAFGAAHAGRTVWMHSASVGEYEQARPVIAALRARHPDIAILQTFFSPSGYEYARRLHEAEHVDYLPEDVPHAAAAALDGVRPLALCYFKFDLWPHWIAAAAARAIPQLLFDATLQPQSWRSRWPARDLYRRVYRQLDIISAVSEPDAARFRALVPEHGGIHVDGDTRFDQVAERREQARGGKAVHTALLATPRPWTLVAGSTWPPDEALLVPAWQRLVVRHPGARLILVPHEPTPGHLAALEAALARSGLASTRYSALGSTCETGIVVVDRVGFLAELYAAGDAAYVGGAFTTGVHSVLEPAITGIPVAFGPRHANAPEAGRLLDSHAAAVVRSQADFAATLAAWAGDPVLRRRMGANARALVEANLGASKRCLAHLERRLEGVLGSPVERPRSIAARRQEEPLS